MLVFMRLLLIAFIGLLPLSVFSQTLFNETVNSSSINQSSSIKLKNLKNTEGTIHRFISTNIESVIFRGDIQLQYEIPQKNQWSGVLMVHLNPHASLNRNTGSLGIMGGGRWYLDGLFSKNPWFLQGLFGFNQRASWNLGLMLEIGQRFQWKKDLYIDVSFLVNRTYVSGVENPEWFLKAGLVMGLNERLLPFL